MQLEILRATTFLKCPSFLSPTFIFLHHSTISHLSVLGLNLSHTYAKGKNLMPSTGVKNAAKEMKER